MPIDGGPSARTAHHRAFRAAQWRMLLATMFCYLFYYTGRQNFGFAIVGIEKELGLEKSTLGWIAAAMLWSYAIGQSINGNLGDKFGGRRIVSLGAVLSCGLNWTVSFAGGFFGLMIPWAANGYVQSMGWAPGSRVVSNWWGQQERGRAYGLYVFAAGMSGVLAFVTPLLLIELGFDWRWFFRLPVLLLAAGGIIYYAIVRDRPEDLGFAPLDDVPNEATASDENVPADGTAFGPERSLSRYTAVLTNWRFLVASIAIGFQNIARYGLITWVPVHFLGEDWSKSSAKWISVALPVGMAFGALASGWISDRIFHGRRWPAIALFMTLGAATSMGMFFSPKEHWGGVVLLFLCGFFVYGPQAAFWALCPDLLGPRRAATGTGLMDCCAYLFAGLGEPFIGWMIQLRGDDTLVVFPLVAVACLMSAVVSLFIRR